MRRVKTKPAKSAAWPETAPDRRLSIPMRDPQTREAFLWRQRLGPQPAGAMPNSGDMVKPKVLCQSICFSRTYTRVDCLCSPEVPLGLCSCARPVLGTPFLRSAAGATVPGCSALWLCWAPLRGGEVIQPLCSVHQVLQQACAKPLLLPGQGSLASQIQSPTASPQHRYPLKLELTLMLLDPVQPVPANSGVFRQIASLQLCWQPVSNYFSFRRVDARCGKVCQSLFPGCSKDQQHLGSTQFQPVYWQVGQGVHLQFA